MPAIRVDPRVELGTRLAELRLKQRLTIQGLAAATELDQSNLRRIESGQGNPRLATILKVAGVLEADLGDLFKGLDPYGLEGDDQPKPLSVFEESFWRARDRLS